MLILVGFVLAVLTYCLFFAREIIIEEGLFLVLGLFACSCLIRFIVDLDDFNFSCGLGIVFLVAGVVYIHCKPGTAIAFSLSLF